MFSFPHFPLHTLDFFGIGNALTTFFYRLIWSIFLFPQLSILDAFVYLIPLFFELPQTISNTLRTLSLYKNLIIIFGALSAIFLLCALLGFLFSSHQPNQTQKFKLTTQNFLTSFLIMVVFPFIFNFFLFLLSYISSLFSAGTNLNLTNLFLLPAAFTSNTRNFIENFQGNWVFYLYNAAGNVYSSGAWNFAVFNIIFGCISLWAGVFVVARILQSLFFAFMELTISYLYAPIPIFRRTQDQGVSFLAWKNKIIQQAQHTLVIIFVFYFIKVSQQLIISLFINWKLPVPTAAVGLLFMNIFLCLFINKAIKQIESYFKPHLQGTSYGENIKTKLKSSFAKFKSKSLKKFTPAGKASKFIPKSNSKK